MYACHHRQPDADRLSGIALVALAAAGGAAVGLRPDLGLTDRGRGAGVARRRPATKPNARLHRRVGQAIRQDPGEKTASINYAKGLRAMTRYSEAAAVMRAAAVKSPQDYEVLGAYGKALADSGQLGRPKTC